MVNDGGEWLNCRNVSYRSSAPKVLWKTKSGNDANCAKAGKDFHMQERFPERFPEPRERLGPAGGLDR